MRAPILALLLLALASSRQAFAAETTDTINAMKANCLSGPAWNGGADTATCQQCVEDIGNADGLTSNRMYACYDVCQAPALFSPGNVDGDFCITCISDPLKTVQACKDCLDPTFDSTATTDCFNCLENDPFKTQDLTEATQYKRDQYFYACAQCSKIPTNELYAPQGSSRAQCYECISTETARLRSEGGILSLAEYSTPGFLPDARPNDFGACVFLANQSYLVATGSVEVTGIYANCVPDAGEVILDTPLCITCMSDVEFQQTDVSPETPLKSYGCADYCFNPAAYGENEPTEELSAECVSCLLDSSVPQAWACGNCLNTLNPSECLSNVMDDPYGGNTSNYNWAAAQCANVAEEGLRGLCFSCIRSQAGSGPENTDDTTEANICSCIDLVANNEINVDRPLTAMERSCYEPFKYYEGTTLVTRDIPWGDATLASGNNSECLNCMRIASETDSLPGINKAYACHEYCQNPDLVADVQQGRDCALCVINPLVNDPWACQACMTATDDTSKRQDCFTCVASDSTFGSHAWGCAQCAQFGNDDAATACYQCLALDVLDPCECVDGVKNGTITPAPQGPTPGPHVVCENNYATLSCTDYNPITEVHSVIASVANVYYGRRVGDSTTCPGPCFNTNYCPSGSLVSGYPIQGCDNAANDDAVEARAINQCVGRASCNVGGFTGSGPYALYADNTNFGNGNYDAGDACSGVYKYMEYTYTCTDVL